MAVSSTAISMMSIVMVDGGVVRQDLMSSLFVEAVLAGKSDKISLALEPLVGRAIHINNGEYIGLKHERKRSPSPQKRVQETQKKLVV